MSDREMLELAAKAAGYGFIRWETDEDGIDLAVVNHGYWQPLYLNTSTNCDGDALRLAVACGLIVDCSRPSAGEPYKQHAIWRDETMSNAELTRRAIVRAAAEIGRRMP